MSHVSGMKTRADVADLIERFLQNRLVYPEEWNDFVERSERDPSYTHTGGSEVGWG